MIFKGFLTTLLCVISIYANANTQICPMAVPTDDPNFCSSFKSVATCHCSASLPSGMCQDMKVLYDRMIAFFGNLQKACEYQQSTTTQDCLDNWNCYLKGGIDSIGRFCSSSQSPCQKVL